MKFDLPEIPESDRDAAIRRIRAGLRARSGKTWSVRGGRGTVWGWIEIAPPPSRDTVEAWEELSGLLGFLSTQTHISVPAAADYRQEYIDRAEGRTPSVFGSPYWD